MANLQITNLWNGLPTNTKATKMSLSLEPSGDILVFVEVPFHDDAPPDVAPGRCCNLWEYEVVELFISVGEEANKEDNPGATGKELYSRTQYLEVGLGPHGHWYAIMFAGEGNILYRMWSIQSTFWSYLMWKLTYSLVFNR